MSHLNDDDKYTSVPNDLLETIYSQKLTGCQCALVMAIWRFTFGFHRCQHEISTGFLSKATGYSTRAIKKELDTLTQKGIIIIVSNGDRKTNTIKINKELPKLVNHSSPDDDKLVNHNSPDSLVNHSSLVNYSSATSEPQFTRTSELQFTQEIKRNKNKKESIYVPHQQIVDLYHKTCISFSKVRTISSNRKEHIGARYKQYGCNIEIFKELFNKAENSTFLKGVNNRNWKADFDWLMNEANMAKVLEGKYSSERASPIKRETKEEAIERIFSEMEALENGYQTGKRIYDADG